MAWGGKTGPVEGTIPYRGYRESRVKLMGMLWRVGSSGSAHCSLVMGKVVVQGRGGRVRRAKVVESRECKIFKRLQNLRNRKAGPRYKIF